MRSKVNWVCIIFNGLVMKEVRFLFVSLHKIGQKSIVSINNIMVLLVDSPNSRVSVVMFAVIVLDFVISGLGYVLLVP